MELTPDDNNLINLISNGCFDEQALDCEENPIQKKIQITLPDYPNCTFEIVFEYFQCTKNGKIRYGISDYQIVAAQCPEFWSDLNSGSSPTKFSDFYREFDQKVYKEIEKYILTFYNHFCGTSIGSGVVLKHISASCYKYCTTYDERGLPISQIKIACGIECCEIYRSGCINADGSYHLGEPGWVWEGLDCTPPGSGGAAHNGIVPASCREISECEYRCGYSDETN